MSDPKTQQAEGTWKQFKGRIRESWGALSGDDLEKFEGQREQLEGYLEKKTGETKEQIRKKIDELAEETKYSF